MQDVNSGGPWRQPGHSGRDRTNGEVEKDYKAFLCIKILKLSPRNNWGFTCEYVVHLVCVRLWRTVKPNRLRVTLPWR